MSQTPPPPPPPQWTPPQQQQPQQQWTPPPQQQMGWGGPGYGGPPPRPFGVTMAAIYLILSGIFVAGFFGGCGLLFGGIGTSVAGDDQGVLAVGGGILIFGIIALVVGIMSIAAGAGTFAGSGWARWVGIICSVIGLLYFGLLAVLSFGLRDVQNGAGVGNGFGIVFGAIAVLYLLCVVAYFMAGKYFSYRR